MTYVVATIKPWQLEAFARRSAAVPGEWHLIDDPKLLTQEHLATLAPRYVFFPHWSWKVSPALLQEYECVCFHMTDVPFGRGGSPLQNLIVRGVTATKLTALRMVEEMDAGPVYLKRPLALDGRAEDIYRRAADLSWDMIAEICASEPIPQPQIGPVTTFARRKPADSELPKDGDVSAIYDFIRMLDAPSYPKATVRWGNLVLEFDHATLGDGEVSARVTITPKGEAIE